MKKDAFFSKPYVYSSMWAIIIAILGFIGGRIWESFNGPSEVIVMNKDSYKDTTITIVQFIPDENYFDKLNEITLNALRKQNANQNSKTEKSTIDSLALDISKQYQQNFDLLRYNGLKRINPNLEVKLPIKVVDSSTNLAAINRPLFILPEGVKGYLQNSPNSYIKTSINKVELKRDENVELEIEVLNNSLLKIMTPFFLDVTKKNSENSYTLIWNEQYKIESQKNVIIFSADFSPGKYELSIGFYFVNELNTTYPHRYLKKYNLTII